jgi:hypothetical protein
LNIRLDTRDEAGKDLAKTIVVITNDPASPRSTVEVAVNVEPFAAIRPKLVKLAGTEGRPVAQTVEIEPSAKHVFKILAVTAKKGENIAFSIKENQAGGRPVYSLTVENRKPDKGRYFDTIYLKTDNPLRPVIEIGVFGIIS